MKAGKIYTHGDRVYEVVKVEGEKVVYKEGVESPSPTLPDNWLREIEKGRLRKLVKMGIWREVI